MTDDPQAQMAADATGGTTRGVSNTGAAPEVITSYAAAQRFLNARVNVERLRASRVDHSVFKLDRMRALAKAMGNPQDGLTIVHVAGSKGKGSVCEMTASCLQACGYKVGLFTSPHLVDARERVRVNGRLISHPAFTSIMERLANACARLPKRFGEPTYFELMTAMALTHFAERGVDVAVLEVGLGGRLDSTNIVEPVVTAITQIQLEHTQILGDSLAKIAAEKAGIFKQGAIALSVPQSEEVIGVLREAADGVGQPLRVLGEEVEFSVRFEADEGREPHERVCVTTAHGSFEHLPAPLKGHHQAINCGLALAILTALGERGFETPETAVLEGLAATPAMGRLEEIFDSPKVIADGAHTPESIEAMIRAIGAHYRYDSMVVVFGCAADKDIDGMLAQLALGADKVVFTRPNTGARAADPDDLQRRFAAISPKMTLVAPNVVEALSMAGRAVGRDDLICVAGSFVVAGEAKHRTNQLKSRRASSS